MKDRADLPAAIGHFNQTFGLAFPLSGLWPETIASMIGYAELRGRGDVAALLRNAANQPAENGQPDTD
jgi:hypothetical protein